MTSPEAPADSSSDRPRGSSTALALIAGLFLGAAVALPIGALALADDQEAARPVAETPLLATTLQRIVTEPGDFLGQSVGVAGEVREVLSPHAFTVGQEGFLGPDLLVVTARPLTVPTGRSGSRPLLEGDLAAVRGEVREFDLEAFEGEVGRDLRREFDSFVGDDLRERIGNPAVLADSVTFTSAATPVADARAAREIVEEPGAFYGKIASVNGRVTRVLPSGAFVLDNRLVVLTADLGERRPGVNQRVSVLGPVRPFDPDQFRSTRAGTVDDDLFGDFVNRPALVAQSIEVR